MGTTRAPPWHVHQTRLQDRSARSDDYLSGGGGRAVRTGRHRPVRSGGMRGVRASLEVHTSRFRNGKDCIHCRRRIPPAEVSQTPTDWSRSCHAPTTHRRRAFARTHRSPQGTPRALLRCTQKSVRPPAFGCDSKSRGHSTIAARGCVTHCNHDRINMFGALAVCGSEFHQAHPDLACVPAGTSALDLPGFAPLGMVEEAGVSVGRRVLNWLLKVFGKRGAAAVEGAAAAEGAAAVVEAVEPGAANVLNILKPPLPQGMSNKAFGQLMRWGSGNDAALARIQTLTRTELEQAGVTKEIEIGR